MNSEILYNLLSSQLIARSALAEKEMARSLCQLRGSPSNPVSLFHELGGIQLYKGGLQAVSPYLESAVELLHDTGILAAGHSHGGSYFIADSELYMSTPSWQKRQVGHPLHTCHGHLLSSRAISYHEQQPCWWLCLESSMFAMRQDKLLWGLEGSESDTSVA